MIRHLFAFLLSFLMLVSPVRADIEVRDVRLGQHEKGVTRFVLETKEDVTHNLFFLDSPRRAVIDLPTLSWNKKLSPSGKGVVKTWRKGQFGAGTRVVLDLEEAVEVDGIYQLPPLNARAGPRLVIDLAPASQKTFAALIGKSWGEGGAHTFAETDRTPYEDKGPAANDTDAALAAAPTGVDTTTSEALRETVMGIPVPPLPPRLRTNETSPSTTQSSIALTENETAPPLTAYTLPYPPPPNLPVFRVALKNRPVIVIDAGHGGVDPGAIAVNGRYEKDLTLAVALKLARSLEETGKFRVEMTRATDIFIPLRKRVDIARRYGADLFISLHADSIRRREVRGATIYTLSEKASDKEAAALAESENRVDILAGLYQVGDDDGLASILTTMSYRASLNEAYVYSGHLKSELERVIRLNNRPQRSAGFAVLKSPDVPSVLIEMGYLSSPSESRELFSPQRQKKMVNAITKATELYFERKAPPMGQTVAVRQ